MRSFKLFYLFICIFLFIGCFSGCNNVFDHQKKDATASDNTIVDEKKYDLKGKTITIAVPNKNYIPDEESGYNVQEVLANNVKEIEKKYNCKIEWKYGQDDKRKKFYDDVEGSVKSGTYFSDIVLADTATALPGWVNKKIIIPLDEYIDFNNGLFNNFLQNQLKWKDRHYGVTCFKVVPKMESYITYNKDIFSSEGLQDPFEMMMKGTWTWDAFLDAAVKTTVDRNGDGIVDQWGLEATYPDLFKSFILSNGAEYAKEDGSGNFKFSLTDENAIEAIGFASSLYTVYKVVYDFMIKSPDDPYSQGRAAMFHSIASASNSNVKSAIVMFPKGPEASDYIASYYNMPFYAVLSTVENPEVVSRIISDYVAVWDSSKSKHISLDDVTLQDFPVLAGLQYTSENNLSVLNYAYKRQKLFPFTNNEAIDNLCNKAFLDMLKNVINSEMLKSVLNSEINIQPVTPIEKIESIKDDAQKIIDSIAN